jgi:thiol-disulfide isomerase/thioredoxin
MSRRMVFINNGESPVKVLSASSDDKTLSFEVIEQEAGKRYDLVVNLPAGYNPPPSGKNIVLALDDSETPELKVPIVGRRTNTRDVTPEHVKSVYEGTGAKFALALDPTRQGNTHFKVASFPTLVLVGKDGTVEAVHAGAKQNLDTLLDEQIQKLLDGKNRDAFDAQPAAGGKPRPTEALVGQKAPQVTFTTTDGKEIKTGVATGKVQVLDFFASWCGYCKKQIPVVNSLYTSKYADNPNVEFVAVSEDTLVQADNTNGRVTIKGDAAGGIQLTPMSGPPPGFQQPQPTGAAAGGEGSK